jgi:nucleoid-associated protein YgaU
VKNGETLEDVAIRVYGSTDQVDLLWRANRDLLPRKNSPLNAGAVLRTPAE